MTNSPSLHAQIEQIEAMLRALPADAPHRAGLEAALLALRQQAAPVVVAPVSPQRDANIATNLTVHNYDAGGRIDPDALVRGYLDGLFGACNRLSLADADSSDPTRAAVELAAVYTGLEVASSVPLPEEERQRAGGREQRQKLVVEALAEQPRLVLLGEPGSGKSTGVNFVALCLAHARCGHAGWLERLGPAWTHGALLPIPVTLRAFAAWLDTLQPRPTSGAAALLLTRWLDHAHGEPLARLLRQEITAGRALLLLDGLDEVPGDGQGQPLRLVRETIQALRDASGGSRVLVTCRALDYAQPRRQIAGWPQETIIPFSRKLQQEFIDRWYAVLARLDRPLNGDPAVLRERLQQEVQERGELRRLAGNPLLLTMMTLLHAYEGRLPDERVRLYEKCIDFLLLRWRADHGVVPLPQQLALPQWSGSDLNRLLDRLGFAAHERGVSGDGEAGSDLPRAVLIEAARAFFAAFDADQAYARAEKFCNYISRFGNGVVQQYADGIYRFPHRTFQEYLAARRLVADDDWGEDAAEFVDRARQRAGAGPQWREALLLAASQQVVVNNQVRPPVDLAEALLDEHPEQTAPWARNAILAGELLAEVGREKLGRLGARRTALWERAVQALVTVLEHLDAQGQALLPLAERVRAGRALAELGDPRFPATLEQWRVEPFSYTFGSPMGYWCFVPEATHTIGGWNKGERKVKIALPAFWVARFPITVAQFRDFAAVGYSTAAEQWWTPEGWRWKQGNNLDQPVAFGYPQYSGHNQPLVAITWYEAVAFAAWLNEQLDGVLPAGYVLRLPIEAEWEAAAMYDGTDTRRLYPWGVDEPTAERAIYDASQLDRPAPVGCCPAGMAACGALDLVGNVWEWTTSDAENYPHASAQGREDFTSDEYTVALRGGAYYENSTNVRCGARGRGSPDDDVNVNGFRVVVAPRLAQ